MIKPAIPATFKSDGCTFPGIVGIFKWMLGAKHYKEFCYEHDFLLRHGVIHWHKANVLLAKRIWNEHAAGKWRAPFYYLFTTIAHPFYGSGDDDHIEPGWEKYYEHYRRSR